MKKILPLLFIILLLQSCTDPLPEIKLLDKPEIMYSETTGAVSITWSTNVAANSKVEYGLTDKLGLDTLLSEERMEHKVPLLSLLSDTLYYFRVLSESDYFEGKARSEIDTFLTGTVVKIYSVEEYTQFGWGAMARNELWTAYDFFISALELDEYNISALSGKAWVFLLLGGYEENAYDIFNLAISRDNTAYDAYAGRLMFYYQREQFQKCIDDVNIILASNSHYLSTVLPHIIDENYLRTFLAGAYYNKAQYEEAQEQCDILSPDNGLVEGNSATWIVNTIQYDSYFEALLALIQSLFSELGYF